VSQHLLLVDDDEATLFAFRQYFEATGYRVQTASDVAGARAALEQQRFDAVLLDDRLPDGFGMDLVPVLKGRYPETAAIVITGQGDVPRAVEAMRRGADHFLTKPVDLADVAVFLRKVCEVGRLRRRDLNARLHARRADYFFGASPAMAQVRELAAVAAASRSPLLIVGETGTGKGLLARWVHERGGGAGGPLVDLNCAALRGDMLANELFGHARGAYTSASESREGLLDAAHGGTLFLDEIGEMDPGVQTQVLKAIEEKRYRRLGETAARTSDFRLIAATSRALEEQIEAGRFRRDLYYRVNLLQITLPPLRERRQDIPELCAALLHDAGLPPQILDPPVLDALCGYPWPGNIRELRNVLERALLLARGGPVDCTHLSGIAAAAGPGRAAPAAAAIPPLKRLEREHLERTLRECGGNARKAAERLGLPLSTFYRKIRDPRRPR
jgi:DNA-binding NtrC family response regulator